MQWWSGTSGFAYKEWKGRFYPANLRAEEMLSFYASRLPAVEINNTFYRMPRSHVIESWRDAVPDGFRFSIKASRRITHQLKLDEAEEATGYLSRRLEQLEDKLGCVLFQLPPYFRADTGRLDRFLSHWPRAFPAVLEFRHHSWFSDATAEVLTRHHAAACIADEHEPSGFLSSCDWVYYRLRREQYTKGDLRSWIDRAEKAGAKRGFAFFKHEDEAAGPTLAQRFVELAAAA